MKTVGIFPGAMKPMTSGHFSIIKRAATIVDELHVFTSLKDRGSISGTSMKRAWETVIAEILPPNVIVHVGYLPVKDALDMMASLDGDKKTAVKLFVGEEDVERFKSSTIERLAPNMSSSGRVEVVQTPRVVRATDVRAAIDVGDFETFKKNVPAEIDAEAYWRLLKKDDILERLIRKLLLL